MTLPRDFLMKIGDNYDLSPEQKDAFVIWFSSNKTELEIATELHISNSALTTHMSHVYKKFSINGKGPGKYGRLLNFLTAEYRKCKASDSPTSNLSEDELNDLVQEVRQNCREMIQYQCSTMRSLTMSQRIDVSDLYTNVNILEKITSHRRREIDELLQDCNPENFDRFGLGQVTETIPGLKAVEKYSKLMVLGKPGSGKTTFLKHLAIQCERGKFQANRVPIFITLKQFAETEGKPSLLEYITQMFSDGDVSADQIVVLFKHGKTLVLLDGLDEVKLEHNSHVINQVLYLSDKFRTNHFVMTCRIAAKDYTFDKFKDVEVADFDDKQIATFARKWFQAKEPAKAEEFIQQLRGNNRIRELATNPLLLTLLCLVFEESAQFPGLRSELYEEGVDILLRRWDETRNIEREPIYKNLSLQHKKDLLSQIALTTFERGDYFFKQKQLEQYIFNYIRNLSDAQNCPEALQLDSEAVLKSIEVQHGLLVERAHKIYSFSHLTFQEYFTARAIVNTSDPQALENIAGYVTQKKWREVFLLTVEMLPIPDDLLQFMKQQVDSFIASDEKLQHFLVWVNEKTLLVQSLFKAEVIRSFYFNIGLASYYGYDDYSAFFDVVDHFDANSEDYNLSFTGNAPPEILTDLTLTLYFETTCYEGIHDAPLQEALERLMEQIPNQNNIFDWYDEYSEWWEKDENVEWWKANSEAWKEQWRSLLIEHRNIGHKWEFSDKQIESLKNYYNANELLVDCLNISCIISDQVRQEIEETLLLPKEEVQKYKEKHRLSSV